MKERGLRKGTLKLIDGKVVYVGERATADMCLKVDEGFTEEGEKAVMMIRICYAIISSRM
jgi:hypothetical protein